MRSEGSLHWAKLTGTQMILDQGAFMQSLTTGFSITWYLAGDAKPRVNSEVGNQTASPTSVPAQELQCSGKVGFASVDYEQQYL